MGYARFLRREQEKQVARQAPQVKRALQAHQNRTRAARAPTGSIAAGSEQVVTITWPTPFDDTNYTVLPSMENSASNDTLEIKRVVSKTATDVTIRVINNDTSNHGGTVHLLGIPDGS